MDPNRKQPEAIRILAPAGSMEALTAAVRAGADEVYLGADMFSARASARNFNREELKEAVAYCHAYGVDVHLTVNTLLTDEELPQALQLIEYACSLPVDAIIVQDLGLFTLMHQAAPALPLHASTQMSLHTPEGAALLHEMGATRVVLAREMSLQEIRQVADRVPDVELEAFAHGALCMSVSGQCYFSAVLGGQSGNRGRCKQPCRLPFAAPRGTGHDLSLKDLSMIGRLSDLQKAGIMSAKIEGRMKRPEYVAGAVAGCRRDADGQGVSLRELHDLRAVFSRSGFTTGYPDGQLGRAMFGTRTYEDVTASTKDVMTRLRDLYRAERPRVPVDMILTVETGECLTLAARDGDGFSAFAVSAVRAEEARVRAMDPVRCQEQLEKTGGTPFTPGKIDCQIEEGATAPISAVNQLRRQVLEELSQKRQHRPPYAFTMPEWPVGQPSRKTHLQPLPLRAHYASIRQIGEEARFCERIYLPLEVPLPAWEALREKGYRLGAEMPRAFFGGEETVRRYLREKKAAGFLDVWCGSLGALALARQEGMRCHGGFSLNVTNTSSLQRLEQLGVLSQELSFELPLAKAARIGGTMPRGLLIYGRLPLMLCRNCPAANAPGGCQHCSQPPELTDRKGAKFPVFCRNSGGSRQIEVLNSVPLCMTGRMQEIQGQDFGVLRFTVENLVECDDILRRAREGQPCPGPSTRGLYVHGWQES